MSENWRTEWSRHYDQIQWTATTILTAAAGALLAYSFSQNDTNFDPWIAFLGLWLTWFTVYYAASFREFRGLLHDGLPDGEEKRFLKDEDEKRRRTLTQWPAFLATFTLLTLAWLWQFWSHGLRPWAFAFALVSVVGFPMLAKRGGLVRPNRRANLPGTPPSG